MAQVSGPSGKYQGFNKTEDFDIDVLDPKVIKDNKLDPTMMYTINTKTSMSSFSMPNVSVQRRFRDFRLLYDLLSERNRGMVVPPLPNASLLNKYIHNEVKVEERRRSLETFLNRVAAHPELRRDATFQLFLEASDAQWQQEYQQQGGDYVGNIRKRGFKTVQSVKRDAQRLSKQVMQTSKGAVSEDGPKDDSEFNEMKAYIQHLETRLGDTARQGQRLMGRQRELTAAIQQFGQAAVKLGKFEQGPLQDAFTKLGKNTEDVGQANSEAGEQLAVQFEQPLHEFVRMAKGVKAAVADRNNALHDLHHAQDEVAAKKTKLTKLKSTTGTKPEKIQECEREVQNAEQKLQEQQQVFAMIVARLAEELERFQKERTEEMTYVMKQFALQQARLAQKNSQLWNALLESVQAS